jgi:hypothetical protein
MYNNFIVFIFLFLFLLSVKSLKLLINEQWRDIKKIIQNKNTPPFMREKINIILYEYYKDYALCKAIEFKKFHRYKCEHISLNDLYISSCKGLINSIKKYNGNSYFPKYANIYISSELYSTMTQLHPISPIPKKIRIAKKKSLQKTPKLYYIGEDDLSNRYHNENLSNRYHNENLSNKYHSENLYNTYVELWEIINMSELNNKIKKMLHYKYNFYFDKVRSNKEVAELMCCSSEHVRIELSKIGNSINSIAFIKINF